MDDVIRSCARQQYNTILIDIVFGQVFGYYLNIKTAVRRTNPIWQSPFFALVAISGWRRLYLRAEAGERGN